MAIIVHVNGRSVGDATHWSGVTGRMMSRRLGC
jgi:hypothetical protein